MASSWRQESITGLRGECDDGRIDGAHGEGDVGRVVGVHEYGRGKGNDEQTATLVMDKHNEGKDGQITGTCGDGSATMGKSSRSLWPRAARVMMSESKLRGQELGGAR